MLQLLIIIGMLNSPAQANQNCSDEKLSRAGCENVEIRIEKNVQHFSNNEHGIRHEKCRAGSANCLKAGQSIKCNRFREISIPSSNPSVSLSIEVCEFGNGKSLTTGYKIDGVYNPGYPKCDSAAKIVGCDFKLTPNGSSYRFVKELTPELEKKCDTKSSKVGCENLRLNLGISARVFSGEYGVSHDVCHERSPNCLSAGSIVTCKDFKDVTIADTNVSMSLEVCNLGGNKFITTGYKLDGEYTPGLPQCPDYIDSSECNFKLTKDGRITKLVTTPVVAAPPPPKPEPSPKPTTKPEQKQTPEACANCSVGEDPTPQLPNPIQSTASISKDILAAATTLVCGKDKYELPKSNPDLFFFKKAQKAGDACRYEKYNEYKDYIKSAASNFKVNENLLLCLIDQESGWNRKAISSTGVLGLSQVIIDTFNLSVNTLSVSDKYSNSWKSYFTPYQSSLPHKKIPARDNIHINSKITKSTIMTEGCDSRCNPIIAIGVGAIYLRYIIDEYTNSHIKSKMKYDEKPMSETNRDYSAFVAGLYNTGPGLAEKSIDGKSSPTGADLKKNLIAQDQRKLVPIVINGKIEGKKEVDLHMSKIDECIKELEK